MENWYEDALNKEDDELVEIPAEFIRKACARLKISPPASNEPVQFQAGRLKEAMKVFLGDLPNTH